MALSYFESLSRRSTQVGFSSRDEIIRPRLSAETIKLIDRLVKKDGNVVYETTGVTPSEVRAEGLPIWHLNPKLANLSSKPSILAFNPDPDKFFLRGSNNATHERQMGLIQERNDTIQRQYPDSGLVLRQAHLPEWVELTWEHLKAPNGGEELFGEDDGFNYTFTDTLVSDVLGDSIAGVGSFVRGGLFVDLWLPGSVSSHLRMAPVIEIPR